MGKNLVTPYPVRMPDDLRAELEQAAKDNGRSLNAEIILRLQSTLTGQAVGDLAQQQFAEQLRDLQQRVRLIEAVIISRGEG